MHWQCKNLAVSRCNLVPLATALMALAFTANATAQQPAAKDLFGDPLPDGATARLGSIRWRHAGQATFAAFVSDGKHVISAGADKTVRVWEYPSGKEIRRIGAAAEKPAIAGGVPARLAPDFPVALSKDGKTVAACFDLDNILVFEVATGKELQKLKLNTGKVSGRNLIQGLAFSPNGQQLAGLGRFGKIRVWDWTIAKELDPFPGSPDISDATGPLVWSPDGKTLAATRDTEENGAFMQSVEIWDPAARKKLRTIKMEDEDTAISGLAFCPDSKALAIGTFDGQITLVNIASAEKIFTAKNAFGTALLNFAPDGTKLYGRTDRDKSVVEWDAADGKALRTITMSAATPEPGRIAARGQCAAWSPDGKLLVLAGVGNAPQFVDVAAGKQIGPDASALTAVHFTPDSLRLVSRNGNGIAQLWDAATGKQLDLSTRLPQGLSSPDGKLLVAPSSANDNGSAFVDAATGKQLAAFPVIHAKLNRAMLFSPNSKMLAVRQFQEKRITLYQAPTGKVLHSLTINPVAPGPAGAGRVAAPGIVFFSPDSKTLAACADSNTLALWNTVTGERVGALELANPILVQSGAFSLDGRCVVLDFRVGRAILFELASGLVRRTYPQTPLAKNAIRLQGGAFTAVPETRIVFGQGGQTLLQACPDRMIRAWDVDSGKELTAFKGHLDSVDAIALSADGKTLASASADTTALIWDLTRVERPVRVAKSQTQGEREACWQALLDPDAAKAFTAICDLSAAPEETLALLKERLKPAPPLDMKRVEELVDALESNQFNTREQAKAELIKMGERVAPAIDKAAAGGLPLENKRRLEVLREQVSGIVLQGERLRMHRAVEILERIGTAEARHLLKSLADGAPRALLTTTAQATLQRLQQRN